MNEMGGLGCFMYRVPHPSLFPSEGWETIPVRSPRRRPLPGQPVPLDMYGDTVHDGCVRRHAAGPVSP
jgi:hypothetical protein